MTLALYTLYTLILIAVGFLGGWKIRGEYEAYEPIDDNELDIYK